MKEKIQAAIGKGVDVREDWEKIAAVMVRPERFRPGDVRAYEAVVANNLVDRDGERFTIPALERLAKTLVGKGKLNAHDWRGAGNGRFYSAHVEEATIEEVAGLVQAAPEGKLAKVVAEREGVRVLVGRFFLLADDPQARHIDAGIARDVSIGFRGAVRRDVTAKELGLTDVSPDTVVWRELDDDGHLEALEASIVWVGAQLGAQVRKEATMQEAKGEDKERRYKERECKEPESEKLKDEEKDKDAKAEWSTEYINTLEDNCFAVVEPTGKKDDQGRTIPKTARHLPHHAKGNGAAGDGGIVDMAHFRNALARLEQIRPVTDTISREELIEKARRHLEAHRRKLEATEAVGATEAKEAAEVKEATEVTEALRAEIAELKDALAEATTQIKEYRDYIEALKDAVGCEVTPEMLKSWKAEADERKKDMVNEVLRLAVLCGAVANEEVTEKRQLYEAMSIAELTERIAEYGKLADRFVSVPSVVQGPREAKGSVIGFVEV